MSKTDDEYLNDERYVSFWENNVPPWQYRIALVLPALLGFLVLAILGPCIIFAEIVGVLLLQSHKW